MGLKADLIAAEAKNVVLEARVKELESQLEQATAPPPAPVVEEQPAETPAKPAKAAARKGADQ